MANRCPVGLGIARRGSHGGSFATTRAGAATGKAPRFSAPVPLPLWHFSRRRVSSSRAASPLMRYKAPNVSTAKPSSEAPQATAEKDNPTAVGEQKPVTNDELLTFEQSKVTLQMTELEQRMFRLAEALKELEPENASRLMLGLKFAREELILLEMQQTQDMLKGMKLPEAIDQEKQILAKLERFATCCCWPTSIFNYPRAIAATASDHETARSGDQGRIARAKTVASHIGKPARAGKACARNKPR